MHELSDPRFFIWEKPRGRDRFHVHEKGAGRRGTARQRGAVRSLAAALEMVDGLEPSTPAQILADIPVIDDHDRKQIDKLTRLAQPGTRLWVLPGSHKSGMGYAATSQGLAIDSVEALFGHNDLYCWIVRWRTDDGREEKGLYAMLLEEARRAWWILNDRGDVLAGGPPIYDADRAAELAKQFSGHAQLGLGANDPDAGLGVA